MSPQWGELQRLLAQMPAAGVKGLARRVASPALTAGPVVRRGRSLLLVRDPQAQVIRQCRVEHPLPRQCSLGDVLLDTPGPVRAREVGAS